MKRTALAMVAIAATSFGLIAVSQAQTGPGFGPGYGHGPGMGRGMGPGYFGNGARGPAAKAEAHLAALRAQLAITGAQEPAWQAFAAAVAQHSQQKQAMHEQMSQSAMTGPERMALMPQLMREHAAGMETVSQALGGLYAVLTPEQRALADQQFAAHHGPRGRRGG
jgi:periplasmic protein CpxP/Spy